MFINLLNNINVLLSLRVMRLVFVLFQPIFIFSAVFVLFQPIFIFSTVFVLFQPIFIFSTVFFFNFTNVKFDDNPPRGSRADTCGQTGRRTVLHKLIGAFR